MDDATQACDCQSPASHPVWSLSLCYDGSNFSGWQIQPAGRRTVQGELQDKLRRLLRNPELKVSGASRTDAGVHALGQTASFTATLPADMDADGLRETLNRWLRPDLRVWAAQARPADFHARHSARGKVYTFVLAHGADLSPFWARYVWHLRPKLNLDAMREAAAVCEGTHDFAAFAANPKREVESTVRTIHRLAVIDHGPFVFLNVIGDSFLYKMVRTLAGQLAAVGLGRATAAQTARVLAAGDRALAAETAPPAGLFLDRVFYAPEEWRGYKPTLPPFGFSPAAGLGAPGSEATRVPEGNPSLELHKTWQPRLKRRDLNE